MPAGPMAPGLWLRGRWMRASTDLPGSLLARTDLSPHRGSERRSFRTSRCVDRPHFVPVLCLTCYLLRLAAYPMLSPGGRGRISADQCLDRLPTAGFRRIERDLRGDQYLRFLP